MNKLTTLLLLTLLVLGGCASTAEYLKKVEANVERMNEENLIKDAAKGCNILPSQVRELSDEDKKFCRQQLWDRESEQRQNKVNTIKPIETGTGGIAGYLQSE